MTRYLVDTNVVSEITRVLPSPQIMGWFAERSDAELFTSSITIGEIWRGILQLPDGRNRRNLETWFSGPEGPPRMFAGRVLAFDQAVAMLWGRLMADGTKSGRPRSAVDMMIAATAEVHDCVVVTCNDRHFSLAVRFVNPLRS